MSEDRDPEITAAAEAVFDEMLADLILTGTISAHREIKRGRVICGVCGTKCRSHDPLQRIPSQADPAASSSTSRASSPASSQAAPVASGQAPPENRAAGYVVGPEKGTGGATGIGSGSGRMDVSGNVFFDCLVCGRPVASNRYAPHLSSCLGFNGSTRRGASRLAATKARLGTNDRSSPSPYLDGSQNGDSDGESTGGKKWRKSVLNGNVKRGRSPNKVAIAKKARLTGSGTATPTSYPRAVLPPSRLGRPPTTRPTEASSPVSSPDKSVVSLAPSTNSSMGATGGLTGAKTLPGMGVGGEVASQVMELSSEGEDDY